MKNIFKIKKENNKGRRPHPLQKRARKNSVSRVDTQIQVLKK